jgi:hypothetical protein
VEFIDLIDCLDQPPKHPKLLEHFRQHGITPPRRPDSGDPMAYVTFASQGYDMLFKLTPDGQGMYLSSLMAHLTGDEDHKPFTADLPHGINAQTAQTALRSQLGDPFMHNQIVNADAWKLGEWNLVARFDKDTGLIKMLQVNVPKK